MVVAALGVAVPGVPAVAAAADLEPDVFEVGLPVVWEPSAVNRTASGGTPTGVWSPSSAQQVLPGSRSGAPSSLLAAGVFPGSGGAGAGLGIQPFYGVESIALTSGLTASVNLATGNLVLRSEDVAFNAPGLSVRVDSFHNSRANGSGAVGRGAVLSTGQDVGLLVTPGSVTFYGPSGFTAAFSSDGAGGWTAPAGINADLVRHPFGSWDLTYRRSGERLGFTPGGYLVSDRDRNGVGHQLGYDSADRLASITDAAGRVTTFDWTASGFLDEVTDPFGRVTDYDYDDTTDTVEAVEYPDGSVVELTAGADGRVDRLRTPEGNAVEFGYDAAGRVLAVERFLAPGATSGPASTTQFGYASATSTTVTSPVGGTSTFTLDSLGRVVEVQDPVGSSRATTWTTNSDVATATDAMGTGGTGANITTYGYDQVNNLVAVTAPTGAAARAQYGPLFLNCDTDGSGGPYQAKCTRDDAGNSRLLGYDGPGNLTSVTDTTPGGGGAEQSYTYQSGGTGGTQCGGYPGQVCSATDANASTTGYGYDDDGNLTSVSPPAPLGDTTMTYDPAGRVATVTDGLGQVTGYEYDARDRLTQTTVDSGAVVANFYDADGNLTGTTDSTKGPSSYGYDALGREVWREQPGMDEPFETGYDQAGNVTSVSDPAGEMGYTYNTANQLTEATEPNGTQTTFGYDANGNQTTRALPNGVVQTTTRDNSGRPTRIRAVDGPTVYSDLSYTYTAASVPTDRFAIQSETDHHGVASPAGSTTSYGYDSLSRLTTAQEKTPTGAAWASWAYSYDPAGNRTGQTLTGSTDDDLPATTPAASTSWGYNDANQLTSRNGTSTGWAYDANGNQTASPDFGTARYGVRDAMQTLTDTDDDDTDYEYTGIGNTNRTAAGGTTFTNGTLGLATEETSAGATGYRRTPDGSLLSARKPNGTRTYYLTDIRGSVVALTGSAGQDAATYDYSPYGENRHSTGYEVPHNPFRYTSGYRDDASTGLYKLGARYYDPTTARFTQPDPTGQETNTYLYAQGDPCNNTDPTGANTITDIADLAGACITSGVGGAAAGGFVGTVFPAIGTAAGAAVGALYGCGFGIISQGALGFNLFANYLK